MTLFKLAQLNSEIKYILHSLSHAAPRYTYPQVSNISEWQQDMWDRLKDCKQRSPKYQDDRHYLAIICEIRYTELAMHLFRPTPRIRSPGTSSLLKCYESAEKAIALWKELYEADRMSYSWMTIHSVCLSALTILYCIWTSPDIAATTQIDRFTSMMRDASVLLSAAGEYWVEARRSRSRLDGLASATVRWLISKMSSSNSREHEQQDSRYWQQALAQADSRDPNTALLSSDGERALPHGSDAEFSGYGTVGGETLDMYIDNQDLAAFVGIPDLFANDSNFMIDSIFSDYQPLFNFMGADPSTNLNI